MAPGPSAAYGLDRAAGDAQGGHAVAREEAAPLAQSTSDTGAARARAPAPPALRPLPVAAAVAPRGEVLRQRRAGGDGDPFRQGIDAATGSLAGAGRGGAAIALPIMMESRDTVPAAAPGCSVIRVELGIGEVQRRDPRAPRRGRRPGPSHRRRRRHRRRPFAARCRRCPRRRLPPHRTLRAEWRRWGVPAVPFTLFPERNELSMVTVPEAV